MDQLIWLFKLVDQMTAPARNIERSLKAVQVALAKQSGSLKEEEKSWRMWSNSVDGAWKSITRVAGAMLAVKGVLGGLALKGVGFAIEQAAFRESNMIAMETILRSRPDAEMMYKQAIQFAAKTPFHTKDVIAGYKSLLVHDFSKEEVPVIMSAAGDFASLSGFDPKILRRFLYHINQIKSESKLTGMQLHQLALMGLPLSRVFEKLGPMLGMSSDPHEIRSAIRAGAVSSDAGIFAILDTIKDMGGGALGNMMEKSSRSLHGLMSTIVGRPGEILGFLDESKGFSHLRGFLQKVADAFDPFSAYGRRLQDRAASLFEVIFRRLGGVGVDQIMGTFEALFGLVERAIVGIDKSWPVIRNVALAVWEFGKGIAAVWTPVVDLLGAGGAVLAETGSWNAWGKAIGGATLALGAAAVAMKTFNLITKANPIYILALGLMSWIEVIKKLITDVDWAYLGEQIAGLFKKIGSAIAEGLAAGLGQNAGQVESSAINMIDMMTTATKFVLGINSPSRVFQGYGEQVAAGFTLGVENGSDEATAATARLGLSGVGQFRGAVGGRSVQISIGDIQFNMEGPAAFSPDQQEAIGKKIREVVLEQIASVGEELAIEQGG